MMLRDAWAADASSWLAQFNQLKRAYEREMEATQAAEARQRERGSGEEPAAKRMRVRSAQVAKERYVVSLTVQPGYMCTFLEHMSNPLWSRVKMHDDGRVGIISASKLEDAPEEEMLPDQSDDEQLPDEATAAVEDAMAEDISEEAFVERNHATEAARALAEANQQAAAAEECGYNDD